LCRPHTTSSSAQRSARAFGPELFLAHRRCRGSADERQRIVAVRDPRDFSPRPGKNFFNREPGVDRYRGENSDLDKFGIDTQVINSTLLNVTLSPDIEFEYALCRAYNTWVHEICEQSSGRLRWNAMLRLTHIEKALEELRRVEALGAAAAEIHGMAGDKLLDSLEFDPFWLEAERLNTPIYVHIGFESPTFTGLFQNLFMSIAFSNRASLLMGFLAIVGTGVAERFPRLRFTFAEAGIEWLPWLTHVMDSYWRMGQGIFKNDPGFGHSKTKPSEILREGNIYVICEEDENLREPLKFIGEDRIMLGSDMPHSESHPNSFLKFRERTDIGDGVKKKILG